MLKSVALRTLREVKKWRFDADPDSQRFRALLQSRSPYALTTFALAGVTTALFVFMAMGSGSLADPATLTAWGASFGPLTTNGVGWWRLVAAIFLHHGVIMLVVNMAALLQLGLILERLVGRQTFVGLYVATGIVANLVTMSSYRTLVTLGASGAICGLYGVLLATFVWARHHRSMFALPKARLQRVGILALFFALGNLVDGSVSVAGELTALLLGFACGIVLTRKIEDAAPPARLIAYTMAVPAGLAIALALPLHGIADVRSAIERVLAVEDRTAGAYRSAEAAFHDGRLGSEALAEVIARTIVPQLQAAEQQVRSIGNVPPEQQTLVEKAERYLHLRNESWQMRAFVLRKLEDTPEFRVAGLDAQANARWRLAAERQYRDTLNRMARAESAERQSLEALQQLRESNAAAAGL
jgi:membrane associated rhomboid family serine protease